MASSIVCAVDGSPHARTAAVLGAHLAARLGLATVAVHAFVPTAAAAAARAPVPPAGNVLAAEERARREQLARWIAHAGLVDVRRRVEVGPVPDVISAVAEEENAALIALGTHGARGLRAMLRGSVSSTLLRIARHPLLLVPSTAVAAEPPAGPVVAALGRPADAGWVGVAAMLARAHRAPLLLAHASGSRDGAMERTPPAALDVFGPALTALGDSPASILTRVCPGQPGDVLTTLADAVDARAIVCGTRGHGALRAGLFGSTARRLMSDAATPVVVCPARLAHRTRVLEAA